MLKKKKKKMNFAFLENQRILKTVINSQHEYTKIQ